MYKKTHLGSDVMRSVMRTWDSAKIDHLFPTVSYTGHTVVGLRSHKLNYVCQPY